MLTDLVAPVALKYMLYVLVPPVLYCKLLNVILPDESNVPVPVASPLYEKAVLGAPPVILILCVLNAKIA